LHPRDWFAGLGGVYETKSDSLAYELIELSLMSDLNRYEIADQLVRIGAPSLNPAEVLPCLLAKAHKRLLNEPDFGRILSPSDHAQLFRETTAQFWKHIVPIVKLGFCIHFIFIFIFSVMHLPSLAVSNVLSVLGYAACVKAIRAGRYSLTGVLMSVEIILHALLATWVLGWDSNFYFYLYCLIPIIAFSFQDALLPRLLLYLAILAVSVGGFALRKHLGINSGVAPQWLEIFGVVNVLAALGVLLDCTALSVRFTRSMQAKLF
jgi:hypothetical protein